MQSGRWKRQTSCWLTCAWHIVLYGLNPGAYNRQLVVQSVLLRCTTLSFGQNETPLVWTALLRGSCNQAGREGPHAAKLGVCGPLLFFATTG